jgi:hypothetical protein
MSPERLRGRIPFAVGRGACDPLGVRSSRHGSGCGGVRRVPRVHCGLHRRVAPQGRRRSSRRRPVRPRRLVRGLVLDRPVDSLLHRGTRSGAGATRGSCPPPGEASTRLSATPELSSRRKTTARRMMLGCDERTGRCSGQCRQLLTREVRFGSSAREQQGRRLGSAAAAPPPDAAASFGFQRRRPAGRCLLVVALAA